MTNSYVIIKAPSADNVNTLTDASKTFGAETSSVLFSLTGKDRQRLNKAADKTEAFVNKGLFYIENNPEYCPNGLRLDLMKVDADTISVLMPLQKGLVELLSKIEDTIMLAKSEQLRGVRKYYNSVAQAAVENDPGAKTIYDDMSKRYKGQGRRKSKKEGEAATEKDTDIA